MQLDQSQAEWPSDLPRPVVDTFIRRGFKSYGELHKFLSTTLKDMAHPYALDGMLEAAERLVEAFEKKEKICIYGDFDLDGTAGVAILVEGLRALGFQHVQYYQPRRLAEGYGLHSHALEQFNMDGVKVVVTVDVGITAVQEAKRAKELGIDLIITDHHQPAEELPKAYAVVNPNKGDCGSNLQHLCGAGVGFYFLMSVKLALKKKDLLENDIDLKTYLDFFIIGTLTDMVPLIGENRVLTKHGLLELSKTKRPGLRSLLRELNLDSKNLTSTDVAIRIAPKLNALSRLDEDLRPVDILLEKDPARAELLVQKMMVSQAKRIELQSDAVEEASKMVRSEDPMIWVYSENFHQGVIGLVATGLAKKLNKPTYVGTVRADGKIVGSARVPDGADISVLKPLENVATLLNRCGGHHQACGFEMDLENAEKFREALKEQFKTPPKAKDEISIDPMEEMSLKDLTLGFADWLKNFEPFGVGFPVFVFRSKTLLVTEKKELRGGHLKLQVLEVETKSKAEAVWFSPKTLKVDKGDQIQIIFEPKWSQDRWGSRFQLVIQDMDLLLPGL